MLAIIILNDNLHILGQISAKSQWFITEGEEKILLQNNKKK